MNWLEKARGAKAMSNENEKHRETMSPPYEHSVVRLSKKREAWAPAQRPVQSIPITITMEVGAAPPILHSPSPPRHQHTFNDLGTHRITQNTANLPTPRILTTPPQSRVEGSGVGTSRDLQLKMLVTGESPRSTVSTALTNTPIIKNRRS